MRYAVILAGGSGTRLWPLSREALPKQLIPMPSGTSLLEQAWTRLEGIIPAERRVICTAERFRSVITARLPSLTADCFIGEPQGRDTLAAIALSCALLVRRDPHAAVAIVTADQVMEPASALQDALRGGFELLEKEPGLLVTFGIKPTFPATGFGWLELGSSLEGGARRLSRFREKPPATDAQQFLAAGPDHFLWNSGMFLWRADRFLALTARYAPDIHAAILGIAASAGSPGYEQALAGGYAAVRRISVDFGVMEPASRDPEVTIAALPLEMEWMDVGSWPAYADLLSRDNQGNAGSGTVLFSDARGCVAVSTDPGHLVACLGCDDLVVIQTPDATLVCPRSRAGDVKALQALVAERLGKRYT